jgi:DNA-binding MarR family transcriptional regulator
MVQRTVTDDTTAAAGPDPTVTMRIGLCWRELRRSPTSVPFRRAVLHDLELVQVDALDVLVSRPEWRMGELAEALRIDRSTATRVVDRLERDGYAARHGVAGDGRGVVVVATASGAETQRDSLERRRALLREALEGFSADELDELASLLERFVAGIDRRIAVGAEPAEVANSGV